MHYRIWTCYTQTKGDDMSILSDFRLTVNEQDLGVYGIHVHKTGRTLADHRFRSDDRENLYSASKTFVAIGIGIAVDCGILSTDDKLLSFFPEYRDISSEGSDEISIENLLMMSSGHTTEDHSKFNTMDRAELFFRNQVHNKPGSQFFYEDLCTYMLGRVIEKLTQMTMLEYLKIHLFDKLDIINPQWHTCLEGHTACSGGLYLTTEEFSRLGILMVNDGIYKGVRVVSKDFIDKMTSRRIDTSFKLDEESQQGYGYQLWYCSIDNSYRADGMYKQSCLIFKDYQAVITVTGHNEDYGNDTLRAIYRDILPHL